MGCQRPKKSMVQIDNNSYINNFELLQENPNNQTNIKISSPKAIIDPTKNDIEIFDSLIQIINKDGQDFQIKSGNSILNEINNPLKIYIEDSYTIASSGFYNVNSSLLKINDAEFNSYIYNSKDNESFYVDIKSDFAKWAKNDNTLVFTSNGRQVETTINFLLTE